MDKGKAIGIVVLSVVCCAVMALVETVVEPAYFVKSAIKAAVFLIIPLIFMKISGIKAFGGLSLPNKKAVFGLLLLGAGVYAAVMGAALAPVFIAYTGTSITRIFLITAAMFGGMSLYGYTTRKDLTSMGSFMTMGLWGIIIAMIVNIFLKSPGLYYALSILSVVVFTGLTAYDTQKIRAIYAESDSGDMSSRKAISGALALYMDFINLFLALLRLFGDRR
mgnify:CR=1 FL=1